VRGFADAVTVTLSPLTPLAGLADSQLADVGTLAVHPGIFVVTVTAWLRSLVAPKLTVWFDTVTVGVTGAAAGWVTVKVAVALFAAVDEARNGLPVAVTVTVPVRADVVLLAAAVTVAWSPLAPVAESTVSHATSGAAVQVAAFVVTAVAVSPPVEATWADVGDRLTVAAPAACVSVRTAVAPPAVNVILP
jgi:hypothetical protein